LVVLLVAAGVAVVLLADPELLLEAVGVCVAF